MQLGLAEVAAVAGVGAVALAVHLVRRGVSSRTPERARRSRAPGSRSHLRQRVGVAGGRDDPVGAERAHRRREQERAVGAAAEGDQHRPAARAGRASSAASRRSSRCSSSQAGNSSRASRTTWVPAATQLLAGAAAGEHRDAERPGRQGALDVVHVVADVDRGALARAAPSPCRRPTPSPRGGRRRGRGGRRAAGRWRRTCR